MYVTLKPAIARQSRISNVSELGFLANALIKTNNLQQSHTHLYVSVKCKLVSLYTLCLNTEGKMTPSYSSAIGTKTDLYTRL